MAKTIDYRAFESLPDLMKAVRSNGLANSSTEARKVVSEMIPKESYFQKKIMDYLKELKCGGTPIFYWKEQAGMGFQRNGIPDVLVLIRGRLFGFEVKRPFIGKLSDIQIATIEEMNKAGGCANVVSYVHEVMEIFKKEGVI